MRTWRKQYAHLDEAEVAAELGAWLARAAHERARSASASGATRASRTSRGRRSSSPATCCRSCSSRRPGTGATGAGRASSSTRARCPTPPTRPRSCWRATSPRSGPRAGATSAAWAGVAQRDFAEAWARLETVEYRDEQGTELFDLPGQPLPPASTPLPVRLLAHWDQPLLAHADRERIFAPEVQALKLTLSGEPPVTVDGRVAASWKVEREGDTVRLTVTPHDRDPPRRARRDPRGGASAPPASASPTPAASRWRSSRTKEAARGAACSLYRQVARELEPGSPSWRVAAHRADR